jgi:hypothetical protein
MSAWLTGERDNVVLAVETPGDYTTGQVDKLLDQTKTLLNNATLWAVKPSYSNPHFLNLYKNTDAIDIYTMEDFIALFK